MRRRHFVYLVVLIIVLGSRLWVDAKTQSNRDSDFFYANVLEKEYGTDYVSLYDQYGRDIVIADVIEDPDTGFAYIRLEDGRLHELGLDFLTMAMVYNTNPAGSKYSTPDEVYAAWWRMYITRWNYLLPEIPLYSNEYYDICNAHIKGVEEHPTNPYWNVARALVDWSSEKADKDIIIGSSTALSGQFRWPTFGKSSAGVADNDINALISGYATVTNTKEGSYVWNDIVVADHWETLNNDGSKTFTITIKDDLKFSDGSPITAKNYVVMSLMQLTPVQANASGRNLEGKTILGGPDYNKYTGPGSAEGSKTLAGMRLLDEYTFSVTVPASYIPYFYDVTYASFGPQPIEMWLGEGVEIKDDGEGCYLSDSFYDKDGDNYKQAEQIKFYATDTSSANWTAYPFSGPYVVESFNDTDKTAVLTINPLFKGIYDGGRPSIEMIIYKCFDSFAPLEDLKYGSIDVIAGITGGKETDEALTHVKENPNDFVYTHYSRAGYGKLGMRCDYGPVMFHEVRQAIAYCMDRNAFAREFTGGYGRVANGPYYIGSWMYQEAVRQGMKLNSYPTSLESAVKVLEQGGWIYGKDGNEYTSGVRYKKIPAEYAEADERIINYKSMDGEYTTTKVGDDYYMPLVINWFGTLDNEFTDLLQTGFRENANIEAAGIKVYNQLGEFPLMLDELYQMAAYGYYAGTPMYCAFNFATSFSSAAYDYAFNMTINPNEFDDYSSYYIKDMADIYWLIQEDEQEKVIPPTEDELQTAANISNESVDVVMNVEKQETELGEEKQEQIGKTIGQNTGFEIVSAFDITVFSFQVNEWGNEIPGSREAITQLKTAVTLTFVTPNEEGIRYQVVRIHINNKGEMEVALLPTIDNGDGTVSVESDKFSLYYLVATEKGSYLPGDINGDGKVNIFDVIRLLKKVTGEKVETFANTDVNGDGKMNIFDVIRLLKKVTGENVEVH